MSSSWLKEWSEDKVELALRLNAGECGGSYAEAVIILCSVLSGISADVWPGRNHDRKRFVELLVKYTSTPLNCQRVSTPLLVGSVRSRDALLAERIKGDLMPLSDTRVITGVDVDRTIDELRAAYPNINETELKKNSYACVLYEELRSGYVHEYRPGERADSWAMGAVHTGSVEYINRFGEPDRLIYFNVSWLAKLVREVVDSLSQSDPLPKFNNYSTWWLAS